MPATALSANALSARAASPSGAVSEPASSSSWSSWSSWRQARGGGRLEVRAVVTDHDIAGRILDAFPTAARAPPSADSTVAYEPQLA